MASNAVITTDLVTGSSTNTSVTTSTEIIGEVVLGGRGPKGDAGASAVGLNVYNIDDYGAVGDDFTDSRPAVQSAIEAARAAGGGDVWVPPKSYVIAGTLNLYPHVTLRGVGRTSTLRETLPDSNLLYINNLTAVTEQVIIRNLALVGPGSGTGRGIYWQQTLAGSVFLHCDLKDVTINSFGGYGFEADSLIVSTLERVIATECGGGFFLNGAANGAWSSVNTSVTFQNTYANNCRGSGYRVKNSTYIAFSATAADNCDIGYDIDETASVTFSAVGCEYSIGTVASPAIGYKLSNNSGQIGLDECFLYQNTNIGVLVTGNTLDVSIAGFCESQPLGSAAASIKVDAGSSVVLWPSRLSTATIGDIQKPIMSGDTQTFRNNAGAALLGLSYYGTPVNYLDIEASPTAAAPSLAALGADTDISINLAPKGAGRVIIGAEYVVTPLSTDTLQNKTMSGGNNTFINMAPKLAAGYHDADYLLTATDLVILADPYGAELTMTLPTAVGISGKVYTIKRMASAANNVLIAPFAAQTIDGANPTYTLSAPFQSITILSDGVNWNIIGKVG